MSSDYDQLLDAAVNHLESLKARGVRHVAVAPETLQALAKPAPRVDFQRTSPSLSVASAASQTPGTPALKPASVASPNSEAPALFALSGNSPAPTAPPSLDSAAKAAAFAELRARALACIKCSHLASSRKTVVFGVGSPDADLMFVGEAPGADEDEQGRSVRSE